MVKSGAHVSSADAEFWIASRGVVGNVTASLKRGDFTWTWGMDYVHGTKRLSALPASTQAAYLGFPNPVYDPHMNSRLYHHVSVNYDQPKWSLLVGIRNLFDAKPGVVSAAAGYNGYGYGNVPVSATQ